MALSVAALVSATAASAADLASLDCVQQRAGTTTVENLTDQIAAGLIAKKANALSPDWSPLREPLRQCVAANHWSEKAVNLASQLAISSIMRTAVARSLHNDGVDPVLIASLFRSMPVASRRAFLSNDTLADGVNAFAPVLRTNRIDSNGPAGEHIGMLAGALAIIEFRSAEFAAA